jgi:peptidoglycan/xylan/chitin deacetylase (PgdA/CDA1 family)
MSLGSEDHKKAEPIVAMIAGLTSRSFLAFALTAVALPACSEAPIEWADQERASATEAVGSVQEPVLEAGNIYGNGLAAKTVVLTYDDGPDAHTLELAQYLSQQSIKATFFINGRRICKAWTGDVCTTTMEMRPCNDGQSQAPVDVPVYYNESILDQVIALGHRIANHTTDHCHLKGQDNPADFEFEVKSTQDIIDRHICDGLLLFRAPFGDWDGQASSIAKGFPGLDKLVGPINWDVDGADWECFQKGTSVQACGDKYLSILNNRPNQNGIFLHHDRLEFNVGSDGPVKLAQYLVPKLKEQGYAFTTLDELLDHTPTGPLGCPVPMGGAGGMAGAAGAAGSGGAAGGGGSGGSAGVPLGGSAGMSTAGFGGGGAGGAGGVPPVMTAAGTAPYVPPSAAEDDGSCGLAHGSAREWGAVPILAALGLLLGRRRRHG